MCNGRSLERVQGMVEEVVYVSVYIHVFICKYTYVYYRRDLKR